MFYIYIIYIQFDYQLFPSPVSTWKPKGVFQETRYYVPFTSHTNFSFDCPEWSNSNNLPVCTSL